MNSKDASPTFPYTWPWENFERIVVALATLRDDPRYVLRLQAAHDEQLIHAEPSRPNFAKIARDLGLEKHRRDRLALDFELIASWYIGPEVQKALGVDVAACRRELSWAIQAASDLRSALRQIDTMIGPTFLHLYGRSTADDPAAGGSSIFDHLEDQLAEVQRVVGTLASALKSKGAGSPGVFFRNIAVTLICEALMEAGAAPVTVSHGKGDRSGTHLHFSNASGRALLALFKLCDHRIDERLLVHSFERVRPKVSRKNLAENSAHEA